MIFAMAKETTKAYTATTGMARVCLPSSDESASVEQPFDTAGNHLGGQQPDQECADDAADEVDTDDVEGVVITGLELPPDRV